MAKTPDDARPAGLRPTPETKAADPSVPTAQEPRRPLRPMRRYDMTYLQCMYAQGHQIPAPGQRPTDTSSSTAVPPGTPTAAPATWPPTRAQIDCEQSGGVWRAALNFCEFPAPDFPSRRWR